MCSYFEFNWIPRKKPRRYANDWFGKKKKKTRITVCHIYSHKHAYIMHYANSYVRIIIIRLCYMNIVICLVVFFSFYISLWKSCKTNITHYKIIRFSIIINKTKVYFCNINWKKSTVTILTDNYFSDDIYNLILTCRL